MDRTISRQFWTKKIGEHVILPKELVQRHGGDSLRKYLGNQKVYVWLSLKAFKRICLHTHSPIQKLLEDYFYLVENQYRSNSLELIQKRQTLEDPWISAKKRNQHK